MMIVVEADATMIAEEAVIDTMIVTVVEACPPQRRQR